jgi:hypothetical protein
MTNSSQFGSGRSVSWMRRLATYGIALLIGFALGYVPMSLKSRASATSLAEATSLATRASMQNTLASAAIDARRGDYESARQATSGFFTALRAETDKGEGSILSLAQREGAQPLFAVQDELTTLVSRNDPAAAERLFELYMSFRELMAE